MVKIYLLLFDKPACLSNYKCTNCLNIYTTKAISRQRPLTDLYSDMGCDNLVELAERMLILFRYIDITVTCTCMLTFIP